MRKNKTKPVRWSKQGDEFNTNHNNKVDSVLPELDAGKIVIWNLHMDNLQGNHRYYMMLGHNIISKLKIEIYFSDNIIRGNVFN